MFTASDGLQVAYLSGRYNEQEYIASTDNKSLVGFDILYNCIHRVFSKQWYSYFLQNVFDVVEKMTNVTAWACKNQPCERKLHLVT